MYASTTKEGPYKLLGSTSSKSFTANNLEKNKTYYVKVRAYRIVDDKNIYVYDVKNSIFNKLNMQEVLEDISTYKEKYEQKIINEGFMDEVKNNTKASIENILIGFGYKEVIVEFN